jgi:hypothetical protein
MRDADSRTDMLVAHVIETLAHKFEQAPLSVVGRSEIRVPTFRAVSAIGSAFPGKKCLAQTGAWSENGKVCMF